MILNSYAILDGVLTLARLGLALFILGLAWSALRGRRLPAPVDQDHQEDRHYLLFMLASLLLFLNVVSWPLLYLLLDSYVPEWPGVMCIYGVTQIGAGSDGPSRWLPGLLQALQALKPLLIFAGGAWMMLYLAHRRTATGPLLGRVVVAVMIMSLVAAVDAVVEGAYLLIPKKEEYLSMGCCTAALADEGRFVPTALTADEGRIWLTAAFYVLNGTLILAMAGAIYTLARRIPHGVLGFLLVGAGLALPISGAFLIDVAAPALLGLPHHHCPYDLLPKAPEAVLAVASYVVGACAVGWACLAAWFASCAETRPFLKDQVRALLVIGLFAYMGSLTMLSVELLLA